MTAVNFRNHSIPEIDPKFFTRLEETFTSIENQIRDRYDDLPELQQIAGSVWRKSSVTAPESYLRAQLTPDARSVKMGVYVFFQTDKGVRKPMYVGISQNVHGRLKKHYKGETSLVSTLPNIIYSYEEKCDKKFRDQKFDRMIYLDRIRKFKVLILPVECHYEQNLLEVLLAAKLKTVYNSFMTH